MGQTKRTPDRRSLVRHGGRGRYLADLGDGGFDKMDGNDYIDYVFVGLRKRCNSAVANDFETNLDHGRIGKLMGRC